MKAPEEFVRKVTQKGQVTIPAEVRRLLGVSPYDKVAFVVEDKEVRLTPTKSIVERTAGVIKSDRPAHTAAELREDAQQAMAEESLERFNRPHKR
ncbi:MAG: AbrB/MazE/SpoVT family DNA-binding domain-containing protein, partial [Thermodesulfobacteriota bacterium]